MRILTAFFFILTFGIQSVFAQFESPETTTTTTNTGNAKKSSSRPLGDNLVVGGGLDLQFGNITYIGVTPLLAYAATDNFLLGGIFTYRYFNDNRPGANYSTSTYGVAPFARYFLFQGVFAHVEYEMLYGEFDYQREPFWLNSFFVGGGYASRIGDKGFAGIYLLWNLTEDPIYKVYSNPVLRFSVGVGL